MKTKFLTSVLVSFLLISVVLGGFIPVDEKAKEKGKGPDNAPVIERVLDGWLLTPSGLERIVFVHYAKPDESPGKGKPDKPGKPPKEAKCYDFLGAKWKDEDLPVDYVIDPRYSGLLQDFVVDAVSEGAGEWDSWTSAALFGSYEVVDDGNWDIDAPDGRNESVFANYDEPGVIAVTVVWGYFIGRPSNRRIIEFDILFDTDWPWGYAGPTDEDALGDTDIMDLQNIATHELGHGVGLDDLYEDACSEVTMYGYSTYGETKKRTLETPDITGIQELYGE